MRIGIDITALQIRGGRHGMGAYLRGLLPALAARLDEGELLLFADPSRPLPLGDLGQRVTPVALEVPALGRGQALLSHQLLLPRLARRLGVAVLHVPGVPVTPSMPGIPLWQPVPLVVTVHDLIPLHFPDALLPAPRKRLFYRLMLGAVRRAAHLLCDSQATLAEVTSRLGVPATRCTVAPLAADPFFVPGPSEPGDARASALPAGQFVLHVGGPPPHKNLAHLLRVMAALWRGEAAGWPLVCATPLPCDPVRLAPEVAAHRERIHVLEDVGAPFLRWLYQHALVLAFPSLDEGFGLPVLEAMACGCPVVTSTAGALPEVGGRAAVYVEPRDADALRLALLGFADPARRRSAREAGLAQARRFSYAATAEATLAAYRTAVQR